MHAPRSRLLARLPLLQLLVQQLLLRGGVGLRARRGDEVHVATVALGSDCDGAISLARTFLAQAKLDGGTKPTLHVFHDSCGTSFSALATSDSILYSAANVLLYDVSADVAGWADSDIAFSRARVRFSITRRFFGSFKKLLYLSPSTVVVRSLKPLFEMPMRVFAIGEEGSEHLTRPWNKNCPTFTSNGYYVIIGDRCHPFKHGVSDGVIMLDLDEWRNKGLEADFGYWLGQMTKGRVVFPKYEQDIFNLVAAKRPGIWTVLPCEASTLASNRWMCYYGNGTFTDFEWRHYRRNDLRPMVLNSRFGQGVGCQEWRVLHAGLVGAVNQVAQGATGGADWNLCDMSNCSALIGERSYHDDCWGGSAERIQQGYTCTPAPQDYVSTDMDLVKEGLKGQIDC